MNMAKKYFDALDNILDKPIAFNPSFKKVTGSTNAALLLSQAFYWTKRTNDPDGWFWKTRDEWMDETGLTEAELDGAREKCRAVGVMEEKLKGVPATLHYRVIKRRVYELLGFQFPENPDTSLPGNPQIPENPESEVYGDFNKESENTSENTSTKTRGKKSSKRFSNPLWDIQHGKTPTLTDEEEELAKLEQAYKAIAEKLEVGLRRGEFPQTPKAQAVYRWIIKKEENGQSLERFIQWAMRDDKAASFSWIYHKDVESIKRDWPQAFPAVNSNPDGKRASSFYG